MIQWLHRYIFKGFGIAFLVLAATILYLTIMDGARYAAQKRTATKTSVPR